MSRVHLISGEAGTGKTTYALSGSKPVDYYEFDAGSWERAAAGLDLHEGDVSVHRYYAPLTNLLSMGKISVGSGGGIAPSTVHELKGWREMFWQFVQDYLDGLKGQGRPVIDTGTKLWLAIRQSFLQEVQEAAGKDKERLNALQYTEPNARHSQIIEGAKATGKDLVIVAHEKELWVKDQPTGVFVPDAYKETPNMADVCLRFTIESKRPVATITKAGAGGLELVGMKITEPTMDKVNEVLDAAALLRQKRMEWDGIKMLLETAAMMRGA